MKWCAGVLIAFLMAGGAAAYADDVDQNKRLIRRLYDELFSKWNFAVIDELISPEFIGHYLKVFGSSTRLPGPAFPTFSSRSRT